MFCVFINGIKPNNIVCAENNTSSTYAKALSSCNLYKNKSMNNGIDDVIFQIPESYFVLILETVSDDCFKVQYDRFIGYVDSSTVVVATFIPIVKTLDNITFDIKTTSGTQIWSNPTTNSDICTTISAGSKNIKYVAYTYGSVPLGGESNIWFYVSYTPGANSTNVYEGYVYSENTTNLSEIVLNTECNPEVITPEKDNLILISSGIKTIIITIIVVPIILFFAIILYKLVQKLKKNTNKDKNLSKIKSDEMSNFNHDNNSKQIEKYRSMKLLKNNSSSSFQDEFDDELM